MVYVSSAHHAYIIILNTCLVNCKVGFIVIYVVLLQPKT